MDLSLYARVIWRFRVVVVIGLALAVVLAVLSYVRVSVKGHSVQIHYRQSETWQSQEQVLIQQPGFPAGELTPGGASPLSSTTPGSSASVDTSNRLAGLSVYYQLLANGDAVQGLLRRDPTVHGTMQAEHATIPDGLTQVQNLPELTITGAAATRGGAIHVARRGAAVFQQYVARMQDQQHIPQSNRIQLAVLNHAGPLTTSLMRGRSKTVPVVIFVTVLAAALGLAFVLENLRPRIRAVPAGTADLYPRAREHSGR